MVIKDNDQKNCTYVYFAGLSYKTMHEMIYMIFDAYRSQECVGNHDSTCNHKQDSQINVQQYFSDTFLAHPILYIMAQYCSVWPNIVH